LHCFQKLYFRKLELNPPKKTEIPGLCCFPKLQVAVEDQSQVCGFGKVPNPVDLGSFDILTLQTSHLSRLEKHPNPAGLQGEIPALQDITTLQDWELSPTFIQACSSNV
jgi:hypothetical protein